MLQYVGKARFESPSLSAVHIMRQQSAARFVKYCPDSAENLIVSIAASVIDDDHIADSLTAEILQKADQSFIRFIGRYDHRNNRCHSSHVEALLR